MDGEVDSYKSGLASYHGHSHDRPLSLQQQKYHEEERKSLMKMEDKDAKKPFWGKTNILSDQVVLLTDELCLFTHNLSWNTYACIEKLYFICEYRLESSCYVYDRDIGKRELGRSSGASCNFSIFLVFFLFSYFMFLL